MLRSVASEMTRWESRCFWALVVAGAVIGFLLQARTTDWGIALTGSALLGALGACVVFVVLGVAWEMAREMLDERRREN
jgi:hypothetical protein